MRGVNCPLPPPPPDRPSAPTPDYTSDLLPVADPENDSLPPAGADAEHPRCNDCGRPLARCAGPGGEQGWTCVVCDDPGAVDRCSCEEALALRAELVVLKAKTAQLQARAEAADEEAAELRAEVADLEQVLTAEARVRNRLLNERDKLRAELGRRGMSTLDQAVLDASHLILDWSLRRIADENGGCLADWANAELARREAKRHG
jgi:hypothetical protein